MNNNFTEYIINGETWKVRTRYENLSFIGVGAYGTVWWLRKLKWNLIEFNKILIFLDSSALDKQLSELSESKEENANVAIESW